MPHLTLEQALQAAISHHQARQFQQAEQLYRQILADQPNHAEALHGLGLVNMQTGRGQLAIDLLRRALALKPNFPEAHYNLANALRDAGEPNEAIAAYRQAIALRPHFLEAFGNLGNLLREEGWIADAIAAYRQAVELNPRSASAQYNLGISLIGNGQIDEAISAYHRATVLKPDHAEAHYHLAEALRSKRQFMEAIDSYRKAINIKPKFPEAHYGLGMALQEEKRVDEAIAALHQSIALKPDFASAYGNLANLLREKGRLGESINALRQAISLSPDVPEGHCNIGNVLRIAGRLEEAITSYRRAIAIKADFPDAWNNLAVALKDAGHFDEAISACRQTIALDPNFPEAYVNLGVIRHCMGQLDGAIAAYRQAIDLRQNYPDAHYNLALALLTRGLFEEGWDEHEWRWQCEQTSSHRRNFPQPLWDGRPLTGATLLLHAEQGFGDAIQFIRYLPLVAQRCQRMVVECQPQLQRLFQMLAGDRPVVARGGVLPDYDVHCPLLSLPRVFRTTVDAVPREVPYLQSPAAMARTMGARLAHHGSFLKVGLVWAGRPTHANDNNRSLALAAFAPLGQLQNVRYFSLQKGEPALQVKSPPAGLELTDWTEEMHDFLDTATLIENLDLVISVDTAVAHLAGAMGKPVWLLLPFAADWRWLLDREDSPWYPTMRLFRQPAIGDWQSVMRKVAGELGIFSP